jgi:hypothetical protein
VAANEGAFLAVAREKARCQREYQRKSNAGNASRRCNPKRLPVEKGCRQRTKRIPERLEELREYLEILLESLDEGSYYRL